MAGTSSTSIAVNIFTSPQEAFRAIRERPRVFLPLLVLLLGYAAVSFLYTSSVDLAWLIDTQLSQTAKQLTQQQHDQAVAAATKISPKIYASIGAVSTTVVVLLVTALVALYYTAVSFATGDGVKYKEWFALVCWCALPAVLGVIAQLVNLGVSDVRFMPQDSLDPLALGNLLGIDRTGASLMQRIALGVDVTALWALILTVIGYQAWTKSSIVKAATVVLGPIVLLVAGGTAIALL